MNNLARIGVALSATVGFSALGVQSAGAAPTKSYLGVYEALNQTVTSLNIEFTVPKFKCESANDAVDAYANTFDQTPGNPDAFDGGFVQLSCSAAKKPVITPFLEADGTYVSPSGMTIAKKDVVDISVTCGASAGSDTIDDVTSGQSESFPTAAGSSCNGAFLGNIGVSNKKGTKDLRAAHLWQHPFLRCNAERGTARRRQSGSEGRQLLRGSEQRDQGRPAHRRHGVGEHAGILRGSVGQPGSIASWST